MSKLIDLSGQDFGYWHVIERGPNSKDGRARWKCQCTLCNKTIKLVDGSHLRHGRSTSCGCLKMEKMRQKLIKDETGKIYSYLKVNKMANEEEKPKNQIGIWWNCTCLKCGKKNVIVKGDYLRNGDTKSCGCLNSVNEAKIAKMLQNLNFQFQQQIKFENLSLTGRSCDRLIFDFGIYNNNKLLYIIEFDGSQHFYSNHSGWNNDKNLEQTHLSDITKNKYCFDNNIPIIRIPYNKNYELNDLKIETTRFLLTPENEQQYYIDNGYLL